jgi:NADH-quinone oxidoreductase subunit N
VEFSQLLDQLIIALPEVLLALFISTFLVVDSLTKSKYLPVLHKATVLFCLGLGAYCLGLVPTTIREFIFSGGYVSDGMGLALKGFAAFSVALISVSYTHLTLPTTYC